MNSQHQACGERESGDKPVREKKTTKRNHKKKQTKRSPKKKKEQKEQHDAPPRRQKVTKNLKKWRRKTIPRNSGNGERSKIEEHVPQQQHQKKKKYKRNPLLEPPTDRHPNKNTSSNKQTKKKQKKNPFLEPPDTEIQTRTHFQKKKAAINKKNFFEPLRVPKLAKKKTPQKHEALKRKKRQKTQKMKTKNKQKQVPKKKGRRNKHHKKKTYLKKHDSTQKLFESHRARFDR